MHGHIEKLFEWIMMLIGVNENKVLVDDRIFIGLWKNVIGLVASIILLLMLLLFICLF